MAENLVVNEVTYPEVEAVSMTNKAGEKVVFYPDAVRYNPQTLTDAQKAQARTNMGAASAEEVSLLSAEKANTNYVDNEISRLEGIIAGEPTSEVVNLLDGVSLVKGMYASEGLAFGSPTATGNTANTDKLFNVSDFGTLRLIDTAYKLAFAIFENGVCVKKPASWFTDTEITRDEFLSPLQPGATEGRQFTIQIRRNDSGNFDAASTDISTIIEFTVEREIQKAQVVDVFLFAGQSNMAGRGATSDSWPETAPTIIDGAGFEFRAISDPTKLYAMAEPFGVNENKSGGIGESGMKTGSMVTAFTNAYYTYNGKRSVVGVSASKGGSSIADWNNTYVADAVNRFQSCVSWLESNNYSIRHKYVLWCQGETDGDNGTSETDYKAGLAALLATMKAAGIEKMFMVRIGNCNVSGGASRYTNMIKWQTEVAQTNPDIVMVSTNLAGMRAMGLMKDGYHYYQAGYNECGTYAGINAALYATTGKEPTMYDPENGDLYFGHKN